MNQSANQSVNQAKKAINESIPQSIYEPISQTINKSSNQSVDRLVNQAIYDPGGTFCISFPYCLQRRATPAATLGLGLVNRSKSFQNNR